MHWYVNYPVAELFFSPMYNVDFSYPAHLHSCLEVSFCVSGCVDVTLNGQCHSIRAGNGIFIPSNTIHSYHTAENSIYYTILFGEDVLPDFSSMFLRKQPARYIFTVDEQLHQHLLDFYHSGKTVLGLKSLLYPAAEVFLQDNPFTKDEQANDDLTKRILSYLQENMFSPITLQDVANHLGYSYYYISKQIQKTFGVSFSSLLSQYRIASAKSLLATGKYTISQVALSCGFGSIRTFNRVFVKMTAQTPSQYLQSPSISSKSYSEDIPEIHL